MAERKAVRSKWRSLAYGFAACLVYVVAFIVIASEIDLPAKAHGVTLALLAVGNYIGLGIAFNLGCWLASPSTGEE